MVDKMNDFLIREIKPRIKASPGIQDVIVWVKKFDDKTGTVYLGLALGNGVGCSPFCGCAANQLAELIGSELASEFPEIKRVVGLADIPSDEVIRIWESE